MSSRTYTFVWRDAVSLCATDTNFYFVSIGLFSILSLNLFVTRLNDIHGVKIIPFHTYVRAREGDYNFIFLVYIRLAVITRQL